MFFFFFRVHGLIGGLALHTRAALLQQAVYIAADEQEIKAVEQPHHGHHDGADEAVGAEAVGERDVEGEDVRKRHPGHGGKERARELLGIAHLLCRHPLVEDGKHHRQHRQYDDEAQVDDAEHHLEEAVGGHVADDQVLHLLAVDEHHQRQQQHQHEDDHVNAGAEAENEVILPALGVIDGVHAAHERLHGGGGRPDGEQYGHRQRHLAAAVYALDYALYQLVQGVRHILGDRIEHQLLAERRELQQRDDEHYKRHKGHEYIIRAGGGIGGQPPLGEAGAEFVRVAVYFLQRARHVPRLLRAHFLTSALKYQDETPVQTI